METDRVIVPDDEKKRILDLSASILPVPDVGIYEGELRYYAASLKWAKIIEGIVSWLTSIAAWAEAEHEGYEAIRQISIFLEGVNVIENCEDIEDCLGSSTIINNITNNITTIEGDVTTIETNVTNITNEITEINETKQAKNVYPPVSVYVDEDLCNASKYTADKIISNANDVFTQKNSSNYADWVAASLNTGFGWIATGLQDLWNSVNGAYAATTAELNASSTYLRDILVLNNLNIPNTIVDVLASGSISTAAKSAISKILEATDQSMIAQWAYVGKASNAGGCIATTAWQWKYATHACTYGLPSGWTMSIGASSCGDGPGSADGIYRSRNGVAAENILTINLPSAIQIDSIRANALCNLGAGYTAGTLICTVNNAGVEVFRNSRTMPLTAFVVHNFTPLVIGNQIVLYSVQNYSGVNPTLLCYNNLAVNAALL